MLDISREVWQINSFILLAIIVSTALYHDVKYRRIPNWLILAGLFFGILINLIGPQAGARAGGLFTIYPAAQGFSGAVKGVGLAFLLLIPFYMINAMGAGDVKLMMAIGSILGPLPILNVVLFTILIAGLISAVFYLRKMGFLGSIQKILITISSGSLSSIFKATIHNTAWRMPFSVPVALGLVGYAIWIFGGNFPII